MKMRRTDRQISGEEARALFSACQYAVLSMVTPDGEAYAVPVNAVLEGDHVYFHSAREGFKNDCMHANSRVCLTAVGDRVTIDQERRTTGYESVILRGTVEELTEDAERIHALKQLCLRYTPDNHRGFDTGFASCAPETALWKVTVTEITGKANRR